MGNNIPYTYTKTSDQCVGTTRKIVYQVTSPYSIQCAWDFHPAPGASVTTSISGCTFTMNYTAYPSSYGLLVNITSPSFPGVTSQGTAGGTAQSCSGHIAARQPDISEGAISNRINIYPNPAQKNLNIVLPPDKLYKITMTNITGANLYTVVSGKSIVIDVSKYSRGVYIVNITSFRISDERLITKIIIQ